MQAQRGRADTTKVESPKRQHRVSRKEYISHSKQSSIPPTLKVHNIPPYSKHCHELKRGEKRKLRSPQAAHNNKELMKR